MINSTEDTSLVCCDKCGTTSYMLLTRQNEKGVKGIFHCEKCLGLKVSSQEDALILAITGKSQ